MKHLRLETILVAGMTMFLVGCSFSTGERFPDGIFSKETFVSRDGDKAIDFNLTDKDEATYPSWSPDQPLPLSTAAVFAIASKELPKYTHGGANWKPSEVCIQKVSHPEDSGPQDKWIYLVAFEHAGTHDEMRIPITFAGVPIQGKERPLDKRDQEQ